MQHGGKGRASAVAAPAAASIIKINVDRLRFTGALRKSPEERSLMMTNGGSSWP